MPEVKFTLSPDQSEVSVEVSAPETLKLKAAEVDKLIRDLAWLRVQMLPARVPEDLKPETQISLVPAMRWQATEDRDFPGQARLFLLHPGFGWLWIPLDRQSFDDMSAKLRLFLQAPRSVQ